MLRIRNFRFGNLDIFGVGYSHSYTLNPMQYVSLPNVLGILSVITQFILLHIYKDSRKGPREEIVEDTTISREDSTEKVPEP